MTPPYVIALAGGTCAGKSTLTNAIIEAVGRHQVCTLNQDSYYKDQTHVPIPQRYELNYDHPDALDMDLMVQHIHELKQGRPVQIPVFDYVPCARLQETTKILPGRVILVDGILLLHDERIVSAMDLILFVDLRLLRRLKRDVARGMKAEDVMRMYELHVKPMHDTFVEPYKGRSHLIIPHSGRANEAALRVICDHLRLLVGGDTPVSPKPPLSRHNVATSTVNAAHVSTGTNTLGTSSRLDSQVTDTSTSNSTAEQ